MWQGEDSKLTVCTLKKQALWSPISMPFAMKGYQSSNNKNTHITWGYGLFNGDETKKTWCLKRSVQVSTTVKKKNTLLNIVHQSNLRTKIASKKLLLSSSTWWFVITPTFLIFTQIFRGSFSSPSPPNPPNTPRKPAVSDDALLYLLLDVWLPTSWWHHLAGQRVRDVGEGGRRAAVLQWIECLSWQSSFTGVRGLDVPMQKLDV